MTYLRPEIKKLISKYTRDMNVLIEKQNKEGISDYRQGIIDDLKDVINDLTYILAQ